MIATLKLLQNTHVSNKNDVTIQKGNLKYTLLVYMETFQKISKRKQRH